MEAALDVKSPQVVSTKYSTGTSFSGTRVARKIYFILVSIFMKFFVKATQPGMTNVAFSRICVELFVQCQELSMDSSHKQRTIRIYQKNKILFKTQKFADFFPYSARC